MLIDDADYQVNVLILLMEHEIDVTLQTIEVLLEDLEDGVTVSVLLNGARSPELRQSVSSFPALRLYESDENLGVAGGRNFLLKSDEGRAADIILVLDNDVVPPTDYVRSLSSFLVRHGDAAVVGGVALDIKVAVNYDMLRYHGEIGSFGNKLLKFKSSQLRDAMLPNLTTPRLFHIGTHPDTQFAYFSSKPDLRHFANRFLRRLRVPIETNPFLAERKDYLASLNGGVSEYEVTTVAGCSQAFRRSLVDEIGELDDRFNPYGFEDVDFCIRARRAGYKNYIDCGTWLYHGTDSRHRQRDTDLSLQNTWRCRTLLAANALGSGGFKANILKLMVVAFLVQAPFAVRTSIRRLRSKYRGYKSGLAILGGQAPSAPKTDPLTKTTQPGSKHLDTFEDQAFEWANAVKLKSFENKYAGERCFIIGNGPSLNAVDLAALSGEYTFGVNGIFYKHDETGFEPTFYVVEDNHVIDDNIERIRGIDYSQRFFPAKYLGLLEPDERTCFLPVDWGFYWKSHPYYAKPRFSTECERVIYAGQTVTYLNMQLAYYMGFKSVYLIGMDFSYQVPPKKEMDGLTFTSQDDDPNHFHKDYFGKGKKWHDPKLENCKRSYEHAKAIFDADGRRIINATVGGHLEVFDRVDINDIVAESLTIS